MSICYSSKVITTSGYPAAILNFRHSVTSANIARDQNVSCIVVNLYALFRGACISVKPATLILLPVIKPPSWISTSLDVLHGR